MRGGSKMNKREAYNLLSSFIKNNAGIKKYNMNFIWISILFWSGKYNNILQYLDRKKNQINEIELYCWKGVVYFLLKEYSKATMEFEKVKEKEPASIEITYFLAETFYLREELEKAKVKYRALTSDTKFKFLGYYGIGNCLYKVQRYDEALSFYSKALANNPLVHSIDVLNKKGLCFMALEQLQEAKECFYDSLNISPDNNTVQMNLALVLSKLGHYSDASKLYKTVLQKSPHNLMAINNLALCMASLKEYDEALMYCTKGLEMDPLNADLLINKGYCLYKINEHKKALSCLKEAEKIVKDDPILLNNKALCLIALEEFDEALKIFNELLEKSVSDDILMNKAYCLINQNMYEDALDCLEKIKSKDEKRMDIYTLRGVCFEKLGEPTKAIESYNKSLTIAG